MAPSAAATPAAAKTAAAIQEVNDENEPGWIFVMVDGSVASVTTDRDDVWDELVLDSGSVSTACPHAWCSDISVNDKEIGYLRDSQQRRTPSARLTSGGRWSFGVQKEVFSARSKFDVADVAYPVVSLGKMIESGFTCSFDDCKCYMHRGNKRVEIFRKGRRMWRKSTARMVAPIDQIADEEMGVADDEEGAGGSEAAVEPRVDEPEDDPPHPRPREVRPSPMRPGAEAVRQHNLTHCPHQSWCVASKGKSDHYHREAPEANSDGFHVRWRRRYFRG